MAISKIEKMAFILAEDITFGDLLEARLANLKGEDDTSAHELMLDALESIGHITGASAENPSAALGIAVRVLVNASAHGMGLEE